MGEARVYKVWPGRNRFFCRGKMMTGPDLRWFIVSNVLIAVPMAFYLGFVGRDFADRGQDWVPAVGGSLVALVFVFLYLAAFTDPGVVPRQLPGKDEAELSRYSVRQAGTQEIVANGAEYSLKFCDTCRIYRPPRCIHCGLCGNCVEQFDHHCPWIGNCVGRRNYNVFTLFLYATVALAVFVFSTCVYDLNELSDERGGLDKALRFNPVALLVAIFTLIAAVSVGGLCGFHVYLLCQGQTTNEKLKHLYPHGSPYSRGRMRNFVALFCSLPGPPNRKRRTKVDENNIPLKEPRVTVVRHGDPRLSVAAGGSGAKTGAGSPNDAAARAAAAAAATPTSPSKLNGRAESPRSVRLSRSSTSGRHGRGRDPREAAIVMDDESDESSSEFEDEEDSAEEARRPQRKPVRKAAGQ